VWLPEGLWFNFFTGEVQPSGWRSVYGGLDETPVFAPAGAIIPLAPQQAWGEPCNPLTLHLYAFPGASHRFELYEDDGETQRYANGEYALTPFSQQWQGQRLVFTIHPCLGDRSAVPSERQYFLHLRGVLRPDSLSATLNGEEHQTMFNYDTATDTLSIGPFKLTPADELAVTVETFAPSLLARSDRTALKLHHLLNHFRLDSWVKARIEDRWEKIAAGEVDLRSFPALSEAQTSALEALRR
jgi:hypothetical protein